MAKPKMGMRPSKYNWHEPESGNKTENRSVNSNLRHADPKCEK
jgi:hypothetical protein